MTTIKQLSSSVTAQREQASLSVTDMAERSGVARAALYRFAQGGDIRLSTFLALTDTLGLDVILAPKSVSESLQATVSAPSSALAVTLSAQPQTGPQSAVEARLAKIRAQMRKGTP